MALRRVEDFLGNPVEFTEGWGFSGVASRSDAEKDGLAKDALEVKCQKWVMERRAAGQNITYDHIQLVHNVNQWSKTKTDMWGARTHECGGTGVAYLFVNV
jgi:hypothetical protein